MHGWVSEVMSWLVLGGVPSAGVVFAWAVLQQGQCAMRALACSALVLLAMAIKVLFIAMDLQPLGIAREPKYAFVALMALTFYKLLGQKELDTTTFSLFCSFLLLLLLQLEAAPLTSANKIGQTSSLVRGCCAKRHLPANAQP